ncbi:hypothetical protein R6Q59_004630 [Mikania micrantha]
MFDCSPYFNVWLIGDLQSRLCSVARDCAIEAVEAGPAVEADLSLSLSLSHTHQAMARSRNDGLNKFESNISIIAENGFCKLLQKTSVAGVAGHTAYTSCTDVQKAADGSKKLSWSDESLRTVMYLSCWGLN